MDTFADQHITYLYFIRTVIHFSFVMLMENYMHLFNMLLAISPGKVGIFFFLESGNPEGQNAACPYHSASFLYCFVFIDFMIFYSN